MKNLKNIFGKKVISLSEGEKIGYVLDIFLDSDMKSLLGLKVIDEESENEVFLPFGKIISQNEECIFIESSTDCEFNFGLKNNNPIGKKVYDRMGVDLGKIIDIALNNKRVDKIITELGEIKPKFIYSYGKECLIFSKGKKLVKTKADNVFERRENLPKIEIMSQEIKKPNKDVQIESPAKMSLLPSMLLNRTVTEDIIGLNNELIIRKGQIITEKFLEKAKKHNKLNYLIFNSK